eukprot:11154734-Lingulodinium_polyedra.AAC.1
MHARARLEAHVCAVHSSGDMHCTFVPERATWRRKKRKHARTHELLTICLPSGLRVYSKVCKLMLTSA